MRFAVERGDMVRFTDLLPLRLFRDAERRERERRVDLDLAILQKLIQNGAFNSY